MKKYLTLFFTFIACMAVSCNKGGGNNVPKPVEKSKEAKLLSFKVTSDDVTIEGLSYEQEKIFELVYLPEQLNALKNATAEATISPKATISPNPQEARDYTDKENPVKFTITAEDETIKKEYKIILKPAEIEVKAEEKWIKKYAELDNVAATTWHTSQIAFVSKSNFATHDGKVFDLDGNKVGNLNTTGLPNTTLVSMSNDKNGILIASVGEKDGGGAPANGDEIKSATFWAWFDGYDKAPKKIYENANNLAMYMNCAGDVKGKFIMNAIAPSRIPDGQLHHTFIWNEGILDTEGAAKTPDWKGFNTHVPANDGNWGQQVCASSGDPEGIFFICDSQGKGEGMQVLYRKGINGEQDKPLNGTLTEFAGGSLYGNYTVGHARGFMYNEEPYVCVASSGWAAAYITVQPADAEKDYLLRTKSYPNSTPLCSSAYVYDSSTGKGHLIVNQSGYQIVRIDIERTII